MKLFCDECGRGPFQVEWFGMTCLGPRNGTRCEGRFVVKKREFHDYDSNGAYEHYREIRADLEARSHEPEGLNDPLRHKQTEGSREI